MNTPKDGERIRCEMLVVGLGAGGGMVFRNAARTGLDVIGLEQGPRLSPADFTQREEQMIPKLFEAGGGTTTDDLAIRVLYGRGVGGSTLHNTNLCKRTPDAILEQWAREFGLDELVPAKMSPLFEEVERDLDVSPIPVDALNGNNLALKRGVEALGWAGGILKHNRVGCMRSGFCELGCAYNAKQNAAKVLVPEGEKHGGRVLANVRVTRLLHRRGRVLGAEAEICDAQGRVLSRFRIDANVVVLAGGAVGSSALSLRSDLTDPYGQLGQGLRMHPGALVAGLFDERVDAHHGIPQSFECTQWLDHAPGSSKRVWIIPVFAHPVGTASTMSGFGAIHMNAMRSFTHMAVFCAMVHDETWGQVGLKSDGRAELRYRMNRADTAQLAVGLKASAELMFAAGARQVLAPARKPRAWKHNGELAHEDWSFARPHEVPLSAVHPMGGMRMGSDPRRSVVGPDGQHHQVRGLFVADGAVLPSSIGGPPQISIYTFAHRTSAFAVAAGR